MNKKFSTLLTAGLLMVGSLFSSAYADKLSDYMSTDAATKVTNGGTYFLVEKHEDANLSDKGYLALGMEWNDEDAETVKLTPKFFEVDLSGISKNAFLWEVSESTTLGKTTVTFKNKLTGKYLSVKKDGSALITDYVTDKDDADANWAWNAWKTYEDAKGSNSHLYPAYAVSQGTNVSNVLWIDGNSPWSVNVSSAHETNTNTQFLLYEYDDETVSSGELNELYNSQGFNLKLADSKYKDVENLLAENRLKAIDVDAFIESETSFGFPAGTYFVTESPAYAYDDSWTDAQKLDYLLNCTFVAVSSTENVSTSASKQNGGEGFQLVTVQGKDLNLMKAGLTTTQLAAIDASKKPCGSDINVNNAAFTVKTNTVNNAGKYSLQLAHFFYQKTTDKDTDVQTDKAVVLNVKSDKSYSSEEALVSVAGTDPEFIFEFVDSNVVEGTEFINADGKSVYNIRMVATETYLSSQMINSGYKTYAVGPVLAETETPAFQYIVTNVSGNNVTFMNRASHAEFTVQLFDEGDDVYSLAEKYISSPTQFTVLNVANNGDIKEDADWKNEEITGQYIELIPVETEEISGYDVEDGTQITLTFARDNTPTSNKMYPVVTNSGTTYSFDSKLTDEVAEAAQWQLVKSEDPEYRTITYAYLDANDKVVYKTKGDTVAYYTYKLQLVEDGNPVKAYLNNATLTTNVASAKAYAIKEKVDGSFILTTDGKKFVSVQNNTKDPETTISAELNRSLVLANFSATATSKATDIKTYLVQEAPEVSLPATATYVTLESERHNYITMDDEKDGIVVSSEELKFRVFATDLKSVVPSFFISTGWDAEDGARDFLFNPQDSVNYYVGTGKFDKDYQWSEENKKALFKSGILNETADTLTTSIKGKVAEVAMKADNKGTQGGLNRFKYQIVLADDADDLYVIRQLAADQDEKTQYLYSVNDKLTWTNSKTSALKFYIETTTAPTANESVAVSSVSVVATNGAVIVKGAAGKKVAISNILGQTVANTVISSDNATIAAPAGIVVVAVEGESAVKVVVR